MEKKIEFTNSKLYESLFALCERTIEKTIEFKEQGNLEVIPYQFLPVKNIDFRLETFQYDWEKLEYFSYFNWPSEKFSNFIEQELSILPEFELAAQEVMKEFYASEFAVRKIGLFSLLRVLVQTAPNEYISRDSINHYIQLFIAEYESYRTPITITWNIQLWLSNIYIESEEIEIASNVFLRRPTTDQLAERKPKPIYISEFERITGRVLYVGAILSFSLQLDKEPFNGLFPDEITREIECWMNVLRLLKPSGVRVVRQSITPIAIFETASSENIIPPYDSIWKGKVDFRDTDSYKLVLKKTEEKLLTNFINNIKLEIKGIIQNTYLSGSYHDLAFHRYNDSLLKTEVSVYRILSVISSLEALLSEAGSEITFKLSLRVAKLLSFYGFEPLKISEQIKIAYNLRSKLLHGAELGNKKEELLKFAREYTHEILNYNRLCLLISLQLKLHLDKKQFIQLIDNSLIDGEANDKLGKLIEDNVKIPIVNPYSKD